MNTEGTFDLVVWLQSGTAVLNRTNDVTVYRVQTINLRIILQSGPRWYKMNVWKIKRVSGIYLCI